jgi:TetR/AcrR family transcriptional repressor of nem operon
MRYGSDQKEATRRRIIEKAGERFKRDGIVASGISTLMADAGLTNGAFYAHFASKDDLVATIVTEQLLEEKDRFVAEPADDGAFERIVREYLSPQHRDDPAHGCPSAALLEEISRCSAATREAYTKGVLASLDGLTVHIQAGSQENAQARAMGIFSVMVGTLQAARAVTDAALSDASLNKASRTP